MPLFVISVWTVLLMIKEARKKAGNFEWWRLYVSMKSELLYDDKL